LTRYVIRRVLMLIPVILVVSFIVFSLVELMPGTFVDSLIVGSMTPEDIAALRAEYELDKPMLYRYAKYMVNMVQGDLGQSMATKQPVFDTYMSKLPNTLLLAFAASVIGISISIPLGIVAARKAGTLTDTATTVFTLVGMSLPAFWLGLMLMLVFSMYLGWFPGAGNTGIRSLVLPAVCSAMSLSALCARQTRSSMLDVLQADFLRTARAKGAPEEIVIRKHALGNALIPIITAVGSSVCVQLAGSAVVEQVFAWPGVGRMIVDGVKERDVTVILGCTIMTTILYVIVMLIVDLLYAFADPRIKSQFAVAKKEPKIFAASMPDRGPADTDTPIAAAELSDAEAISPHEHHFTTLRALLKHRDNEAEDEDESSQEELAYSGAQDFVTRQNKDIVLGDLSTSSDIVARYKKRSQLGEIWHRMLRNKSALTGLIILGVVVIIAIIAIFIPFEMSTATNMSVRYSPPVWRYPFGTDSMGRNLFLRVIYGSQYSLVIGFGAVFVSMVAGVALGSVAGYYGGKTDNIVMRISDVLASIPGLLLGMVIMVVLGMNMPNLIIAVGVGGIPHFIRMSRAAILTVKGNEFVEAARAIGFSNFRIITTQVLPNGLSPIMVQASISLGFSIMIAAALSFLGYGIPPPAPEWGALVSAGREASRAAPWLMAFPGLAIMVTVLGFNLLGDGLRDAMDPKQKK